MQSIMKKGGEVTGRLKEAEKQRITSVIYTEGL